MSEPQQTEPAQVSKRQPRRWQLFVPLGIFILLASLLYVGLSLDPNELPSVLIDKPVPEFALPSLSEPEKTLTKKDLPTGAPYLINVWATWCPTCKHEHPFLLKLAKMGIPIVGVNYQDEAEAASRLLANAGDPYLKNIVDEEGSLILSLGVTGAPETFVVDAEGIIRYRVVGVVNQSVWTGQLAQYFIGE